jgi:hypothetical protein
MVWHIKDTYVVYKYVKKTLFGSMGTTKITNACRRLTAWATYVNGINGINGIMCINGIGIYGIKDICCMQIWKYVKKTLFGTGFTCV